MTELILPKNKKETDDGEVFNNLKKREGVTFTQGQATNSDYEGQLMAVNSGKTMCDSGYIHRGVLMIHIYESEKPVDTIRGSHFETLFKSFIVNSKEARWSQVIGAVQQLEAKVKAAFDKK